MTAATTPGGDPPPAGPDVGGLASFRETCAQMGLTWAETAAAVLRWQREQGAATETDR